MTGWTRCRRASDAPSGREDETIFDAMAPVSRTVRRSREFQFYIPIFHA